MKKIKSVILSLSLLGVVAAFAAAPEVAEAQDERHCSGGYYCVNGSCAASGSLACGPE